MRRLAIACLLLATVGGCGFKVGFGIADTSADETQRQIAREEIERREDEQTLPVVLILVGGLAILGAGIAAGG